MSRGCSIPGCPNPHDAKGLCKRHYGHLPGQQKKKKEWANAHREERSWANRPEAYRKHRSEVLKQRSRTPKGKYDKAQRDTRGRGMIWTISFEEFARLNSSLCTYCDDPLPEVGHGLDRKDNSVGYTIENVVPCCDDCNKTRGDRYSFQEMKEILSPVLRYLKQLRREKTKG